MATLKGESDKLLDEVRHALERYEAEHPGAEATLFRQNPASIRIRIIDRRFEGMTKGRRHDSVVAFLKANVSEETFLDISQLVLIPQAEINTSFANLDFEEPITSRL